MKIKLPKELRGFSYYGVCPVELNDFDVDLLLPSVFFRVVAEGAGRARYPNDPERIREYVEELANHDAVQGFVGAHRLRLLERLVRTSLIYVGRRGQSRRSEQIEGMQGNSILTLKPGFPEQHSRLRRVDMLVYRILRDGFRTEKETQSFFLDIFGRGVTLSTGMEPDGTYDGITDIDTLTRLSIALLDGFQTTRVRQRREREFNEALPGVAKSMARALVRYMKTYHTRMPVESFMYHLKVLISLELFFYTLKLFHAIPALVANPEELPPAMQSGSAASPPDVFCDFTENARGLSREMARYCVRRDLETIQQFIPANLYLRHLDRYLRRLPNKKTEDRVRELVASAGTGPEYLQSMLLARTDPLIAMAIDARAAHDEDLIRQENRPPGLNDDDDMDENPVIDRVAEAGDTAFDRLILLLTDAQVKTIARNVVAWYRSVGGLTQSHRILTGAPTSRLSWRYAPTSDVLATLVQLAAIDHPRWSFESPTPRPVTLRAFLAWLEKRFGILVDHPPDEFTGPEYVAAAQENLQAMLRRLQQMGIFRDLSDDFTVQRLTPPYMTTREERLVS